jgi:hypothetical protein
MMKLFMVRDRDRWGYSLNVVEAADEEGALRAVRPKGPIRRDKFDVDPLEPKGTPGILWCEDESPATPREE